MFYNTDEVFPPLDFARMVEDSGIDSIWLPEHSHVPVASQVPDGQSVNYGCDEEARKLRFAGSPPGGGSHGAHAGTHRGYEGDLAA